MMSCLPIETNVPVFWLTNNDNKFALMMYLMPLVPLLGTSLDRASDSRRLHYFIHECALL